MLIDFNDTNILKYDVISALNQLVVVGYRERAKESWEGGVLTVEARQVKDRISMGANDYAFVVQGLSVVGLSIRLHNERRVLREDIK